MKKLNKIILFFIIFLAVLLISTNISFAAETVNVRNNLKKGSRGEQVELLQKELNAVMNAGLEEDGSFGSKTRTAVINFQKKYNLDADGIAGPTTCSKLNVEYLAKNNYVTIFVEPSTNGGKLNVRAKANSSSAKLGTISSGTSVIYYGTTTSSSGKTWYKIKYNGQDAYISGSYTYKTCVSLDISDQLLKFYKDGKLKLETPVVTGNNGNNGTVAHKTPTGRYLFKYKGYYYDENGEKQTVYYRKSPATLKGSNDDGTRYETPVNYWMNFITSRGIGFHDAGWRASSQFHDVNTYLTKGSHGCVNMRPAAAKELYNILPDNTYVLIVQ